MSSLATDFGLCGVFFFFFFYIHTYRYISVHHNATHRSRNDFLASGAKIEWLFGCKKQKLAKNNWDNQIQSITLCNMYFSKKICAVYNGVWGKTWEAGEFSRIFVLKVTVQCVRLLLVSVSYGRSPNNVVGGAPLVLTPMMPLMLLLQLPVLPSSLIPKHHKMKESITHQLRLALQNWPNSWVPATKSITTDWNCVERRGPWTLNYLPQDCLQITWFYFSAYTDTN